MNSQFNFYRNSRQAGAVPLLLLFMLMSGGFLSAQSCDCTEYIYINEETNGGVVHKFSVDPTDGSLDELFTPGGDPWNTSTDLTNPHGLASDLNGFLYIGNTFDQGRVRRLTCDGTLLPETDFVAVNGNNTANLGSVGNTLYTNTGTSYDLCDGSMQSSVSLCGASGVAWGFHIDPLTKDFFSSGSGNIYKYSASDYGSGNCIPAFITRAEIEANLPDYDGDPSTPPPGFSGEDAIYGITTDRDGNIYAAIWYRNRRGLIMKFDANGNFDTLISGDPGPQMANTTLWAPRGIVYKGCCARFY